MNPKVNTKEAMGTSPRSENRSRDKQGWEEEEHFPLLAAAAPP